MAKKKPLLDNLKYIFCKDATNGKQAGFDVQLMRDRLTEIRYDIDHIQGDLDNIITGDLPILITALMQSLRILRTLRMSSTPL